MIVPGPLDPTVLAQALGQPFTASDPNASEVEVTGPSDADIIAAADAARAQATNERTIRTTTTGDLDALATIIANLNAVVDKTNAEITAADTKAVAREARAVARATRRLIRLVLQNFDSVE